MWWGSLREMAIIIAIVAAVCRSSVVQATEGTLEVSGVEMNMQLQATSAAAVFSDGDALCALYNTVPAASKAKLTNWCGGKLSNATGRHTDGPCVLPWLGVTCANGCVTALSLPSQLNLETGWSIPTQIGLLKNLTVLRLDFNSLSGSIPTQLGLLTGLTVLNLHANTLSGSIPSQLEGLTGLTVLNLVANGLTGSIPSQLGELTGLKVLGLGTNSLTGTIPTELGLLTGLTRLDLYGNSLSGSIPTQLGELTGLTWLSLGINSLSGSIPTQLGLLTGLNQLYLCCQHLDGSIPTQLGGLTGLIGLSLCRNNLSGPIPPQLGGLTGLTELELDTNSLAGPVPAALCGLEALSTLSVAGNPLLTSYPQCLSTIAKFIKDPSLEPFSQPTAPPTPRPSAPPSFDPNPSPSPNPSSNPSPNPHLSTSSRGGVVHKLGGVAVVAGVAATLGLLLLGALGVSYCYRRKQRGGANGTVRVREDAGYTFWKPAGLAGQEWGRGSIGVGVSPAGAGGGGGGGRGESCQTGQQDQQDGDIIPRALPARASLASTMMGQGHAAFFGSTTGRVTVSAAENSTGPTAGYAGHVGTFNNL